MNKRYKNLHYYYITMLISTLPGPGVTGTVSSYTHPSLHIATSLSLSLCLQRVEHTYNEALCKSTLSLYGT